MPQRITGREALVTTLVRASEVATEMRKKMRAAYWSDPPVFAKGTPAPKMREIVMGHFDRVALPAATDTDSVQIIKTSAKVLTMIAETVRE